MPAPGEWAITATRPVLIVSDVDRAMAFYGRIGFEREFRNGVVYAVVRMGAFSIHLGTRMDPVVHGVSQAVIEMRGVDAYYAFCIEQGVRIHREIQDRFYGMRDFQLTGPGREHRDLRRAGAFGRMSRGCMPRSRTKNA